MNKNVSIALIIMIVAGGLMYKLMESAPPSAPATSASSLNAVQAHQPARIDSALNSISESMITRPVFADKKGAEEALAQAPELLVGSKVRDSAGCLYGVGADGSRLVLVPIGVKGERICATKK